jgi:3',5'-cyclic AMP phosphodiesterase CpdA
MKLIQVSDTHLGEAGERVFGLDPAASLDQCVTHINGNHADAELCLVTGDLVNRGMASEYAGLKRILSRLAMPYRLIPGNHDARETLRAGFPELPFEAGEFLHQSVATSQATVLLLDTHEPGKESGRLCERRLGWIEERLAGSAQPVLVFMHHPPLAIGHQAMDRMPLRNPGPFLELLGRYRSQVRHVFFGHVHRPFFAVMDGIGYSSVPGTCHQISLMGMERGDLYASSEPGGYGVILFDGTGAGVHIQSFAEAALFEV